MNKKQLLKDFIMYFVLFLIVPISLYINFFIFQLTIWKYEIKAWIIYSFLILIYQIIIIIFTRKVLYIVILKYKLFQGNLGKDFISLSSIAFLLGNIFLSLAIYRLKMWYYLPLFQGLIILLLEMRIIKKNFTKKNKLPLFKQVFTFKKIASEQASIFKKYYLLLLFTILIYIFLSMILFFIIEKSYNPLKKSLEYYMVGSGLKPKFK